MEKEKNKKITEKKKENESQSQIIQKEFVCNVYMNIVEGAIDYVRNKALEIKKDPTWTDIPFKKKKDFINLTRKRVNVVVSNSTECMNLF